MNTKRALPRIALAGVAALLLSQSLSASAQERKGRVIIHTPEGDQVIDLDPSQLPPPGDGNQVVIMRMGQDGQAFTFTYAGGLDGLMLKGLDGASFGPGGMMQAGPNGAMLKGGLNIIDPGRSYLLSLLRRDDVQAHLYLTPRQKEALVALEKGQQDAMQQQVKQNFAGLGSDLKGKSQDEIQELVKERARKMQEQAQTFATERDQKMTAILTPKQMTRLKELDLQWRGPLAMGVKDVAESAKLTPEQSPKVTDLLKEYRQEVNRHLSFLRPTVARAGQGAGAGAKTVVSSPPALSPAEMQAKMEQAQKEIEKTRKSLGAKTLQGVSEEQRGQWSALTGKPFLFRSGA